MSVENPHVQRLEYCRLLEAEYMQRLPAGRGHAVERDVQVWARGHKCMRVQIGHPSRQVHTPLVRRGHARKIHVKVPRKYVYTGTEEGGKSLPLGEKTPSTMSSLCTDSTGASLPSRKQVSCQERGSEGFCLCRATQHVPCSHTSGKSFAHITPESCPQLGRARISSLKCRRLDWAAPIQAGITCQTVFLHVLSLSPFHGRGPLCASPRYI